MSISLIKKLKTNFILIPILGLLVVFPLGQLERVRSGWSEIGLYWHDFAVLAIIFSLCIYIVIKRSKLIMPDLIKPIMFFFTIGLISLLVNAARFPISQTLIGSLYLWRWLAYAFIYFALVQIDENHRKKIVDYLLLAGLISAVFGLLQYWLYPNAWPLTADNWDPHMGRVIGTFLDPGFTGLIYALTLILLLVTYWQKKKPGWWYLSILLGYSALLLTYSRSAYLSLAVGVGAICLVKRKPRLLIGFMALFLSCILLLPRPHGEGTKLERQSTINARLINWQQSLSIIEQSPILGVGFNLYRYQQHQQGFLKEKWQLSHAGAGADSSLLFVMAVSGIIGLAAYSWLGYQILSRAWQSRKRSLGLVLLASTLAVIIHSFFNNSLFYAWIMIWMWLIIGLFESKNQGV